MEDGLEKHPVDRSKLNSETQKLIEQYSNDKYIKSILELTVSVFEDCDGYHTTHFCDSGRNRAPNCKDDWNDI